MTLDARRGRLWAAMGLGPQWVLRSSDEPGPLDEAAAIVPAEPPAAPAPQRHAAEPAAIEAGGDERAQRIARMDWGELQASVAGCTACGLCRTRTQTVFGVGNPAAHCMIVGEAPGAEEDARGEPFVGQAGRLLDNMLAAVSLSRTGDAPQSSVYIANVLKCRPPGNRNPAPDEVGQCEPYLLRQMELIRPKLIVVMGRFAAQSLLGTEASIASLRGRVHHIDVAGRRVPVVVTYHPAYLLRNLADKSKSWADLCLARRTLAA